MEEKMMSEVAKQNENIEDKVEEVIEEKVEDEKPKSKGIFSRVKSLFKRK